MGKEKNWVSKHSKRAKKKGFTERGGSVCKERNMESPKRWAWEKTKVNAPN